MKKFSEKYFQLINTKFKGLNLTRINTPEEFYKKQILDSILPFEDEHLVRKHFDKIHNKIIVDIGFGGGVPILPLKELFGPEATMVGIEARRKKVLAVHEIAKDFGYENIHFVHGRLEQVCFDTQCLLLFKAVGDIKALLGKANKTDGVRAYFYKGPNLDELEPGWESVDGWVKICDYKYRYEGAERRFVGFESVQSDDLNMKKNVVKLSEVILNVSCNGLHKIEA